MEFIVQALLTASVTAFVARVLLTFPFWSSGLAKVMDFQATVGEMEHFGFTPGIAFGLATIIVQLSGSALVIANRLVWLGAGALAVFTALTIVLVHTFWKLEEPMATFSFYTAVEHVGMIGGLLLVSILSAREASARA